MMSYSSCVDDHKYDGAMGRGDSEVPSCVSPPRMRSVPANWLAKYPIITAIYSKMVPKTAKRLNSIRAYVIL